MLIAGIFLNFMTALTFSISYAYRTANYHLSIKIIALIFTAPLWASCFVLTDAFRRFRSTKTSEQTINNLKIAALTLSFLVYAIGQVYCISINFKNSLNDVDSSNTQTIRDNYIRTRWAYEIIVLAFWSSDLVLAIVLY